jgi:hypothetical protein
MQTPVPPQMPSASQAQPQQQQPFPAAFMSSMYQMFLQAQNQPTQLPGSSSTSQQQPTPSAQDSQIQPQPFDDHALAKSIFEKTSQGMSYKSAIETLHFVSTPVHHLC